MRDHSGEGHHFYGCDGNGNVTVLVKAADQTVSAKYEYDPFLDPIRVTGAMALSAVTQNQPRRVE